MNIYLINIVILLFLSTLEPLSKYQTNKTTKAYRFVCIVSFLILFLEMGLRGDFDIDTLNYYRLFQESDTQTFKEIFELPRDVGYFSFSKLFSSISNEYLYFLLALAFIEATAYIKFINRESASVWLSMLILLCSGSYYSGFNIMRELLAASLFALCYKFIYDRRWKAYIISVLLVSSIHLSCIFMLPLYFLPNFRWSKASAVGVIAGTIGVSAILYVLAYQIAAIVTGYMYSGYSDLSHFGMDEGISFAGTMKAVVLSGGVVLGYKYFDKTSPKEMLIFNGCILNIIVAICGYKIFMIQRLTHFLVPCLMVGYPLVLTRIPSKKRKFYVILVVLLFIASIANTIMDSEYYIYLFNNTRRW